MSLIQQRVGVIEAKYTFEKEIRSILEKYDVRNNVLGFDGGHAKELSSGFMCPVKEYDSLEEAVRGMNPTSQVLRIVENNKFIVGDYFVRLIECVDRGDVFNIEHLENVY